MCVGGAQLLSKVLVINHVRHSLKWKLGSEVVWGSALDLVNVSVVTERWEWQN